MAADDDAKLLALTRSTGLGWTYDADSKSYEFEVPKDRIIPLENQLNGLTQNLVGARIFNEDNRFHREGVAVIAVKADLLTNHALGGLHTMQGGIRSIVSGMFQPGEIKAAAPEPKEQLNHALLDFNAALGQFKRGHGVLNPQEITRVVAEGNNSEWTKRIRRGVDIVAGTDDAALYTPPDSLRNKFKVLETKALDALMNHLHASGSDATHSVSDYDRITDALVSVLHIERKGGRWDNDSSATAGKMLDDAANPLHAARQETMNVKGLLAFDHEFSQGNGNDVAKQGGPQNGKGAYLA